MSQFLATHGFRFLQQDEIDVQELSDDIKDGYIFELDLHYATRLHNRHNDYPLAPESLVIDRDMYLSTQKLHLEGGLLPICGIKYIIIS